MTILPAYDDNGYAIPFADEDPVLEACAALEETESYDDPAEWPAWVDDCIWELGPESPPQEPTYEPTPEDWADYCQWSDRLEALERLQELDRLTCRDDPSYLSDRDIAAGGLPVG